MYTNPGVYTRILIQLYFFLVDGSFTHITYSLLVDDKKERAPPTQQELCSLNITTHSNMKQYKQLTKITFF